MITWTPNDTLIVTSNVNENFTFDITAVFTPDTEGDLRTLTSITTVIDETVFQSYFTITEIVNSSVSRTNHVVGNVPVAVFDQYSTKYVDQNQSDKTQTPVIAAPQDVPDGKELYEVHVDDRLEIIKTLTVTVTQSDNTTESKQYQMIFIQTYDDIRDWIQDYFENRY